MASVDVKHHVYLFISFLCERANAFVWTGPGDGGGGLQLDRHHPQGGL